MGQPQPKTGGTNPKILTKNFSQVGPLVLGRHFAPSCDGIFGSRCSVFLAGPLPAHGFPTGKVWAQEFLIRVVWFTMGRIPKMYAVVGQIPAEQPLQKGGFQGTK